MNLLHEIKALLIALLLCCTTPLWVADAAPASKTYDYQSDVLPILESHCIKCHGPKKQKGKTPFLAAMRIENSDIAWNVTLPAQPIKGGTSIDHQGRIFVTLENGQTLCYAAP